MNLFRRFWLCKIGLIVSLTVLSCEGKPKVTIPPTEKPSTEKPRSQKTSPTKLDRTLSDVHTHISPYAFDFFAKRMDDLSIRRVVNMSGGSSGEVQAFSLQAAEKHPDRFAQFMNVDWEEVEDPDFGTTQAIALTRAVRSGFAGLKISKSLGLGIKVDDALLPVDDPRLDPLWAAAGKLGVVVAIHTSDPKAFFEKPGPQNERHAELSYAPSWSFYGDEFPSRNELLAARDRMVAKHRGTTFMLLHFANNPEDIDYVDRLLDEHPNVIVDIAARIGEIGRHDAGRVREIFQKHQDRILFASDIQVSVIPKGNQVYLRLTLGSVSETPPKPESISPFFHSHFAWLEKSGDPIAHPVPIQGDWLVNPLGLSDEVLRKVYFKNAERVIFSPWMARERARHIENRAIEITR